MPKSDQESWLSRQLCQSIVEFFHKRERGGQMLLAMPRFVSFGAHSLACMAHVTRNDPLIKPLEPGS